MQYHIQTTPVWDAFKAECDCPLCEIYAVADTRLVNQYLNEAVMEPAYRIKVNKVGFCDRHLIKLYNGENKLGLSLQLQTRTDHIITEVKSAKTPKDALKQAQNLEKTINTCVICESVEEMMNRYAYTIAQMFAFEPQFPQLFAKSNGFCMPHYILLLKNASKAGKSAPQYLADLTAVQTQSLKRMNTASKSFSDMFDYRSNKRPSKNANEIVPNAINKLKGRIVK